MGSKLGYAYSILKLGGSLITDKSKPYYLREDVIRRIAKELQGINNLILIHGGGSFGHYEASKGDIVKTSLAMQKLNLLVSSILYDEGIKIFPFPGRFFSVKKTVDYIKANYVPLIYGDIDEYGNIISGDDIAVILAKELSSRALFATDVDGVISNNKVLEEVNDLSFNVINTNNIYDVTGGIKSKIKKILEKCVEGIIFNGLKEGNINKVLKGERIGTLVRCKK
ncbi:isopentenyl phosphate kinase [Acidianus sulfidivorans]|nr:isopentenyl phosphate kinase [Acidianus sulfidivorans]